VKGGLVPRPTLRLRNVGAAVKHVGVAVKLPPQHCDDYDYAWIFGAKSARIQIGPRAGTDIIKGSGHETFNRGFGDLEIWRFGDLEI
jgi:hypothetical protein